MKSYWVVSPNVSPTKPDSLSKWEQIILRRNVAIMGWGQDHKIGRRFVQKIKPGDVILVARRHRRKAAVVGFGIVQGKSKIAAPRGQDKRTIRGLTTPGSFGSFRNLSRFIKYRGHPPGVTVSKALTHTMALAKLHPRRRAAHMRLCDWMDQLLLNGDAGKEANKPSRDSADKSKSVGVISLESLPKTFKFGYAFHSKRSLVKAMKLEARLVTQYRRWIWNNYSRRLFTIKIGKLICDCFEKERRNLIEAKSSISRENIRMAAGQLRDYGFHAKRKFGKVEMAILLPKRPQTESVTWLRPLKIGLVWREKAAFVDNANGRFT